MKNNCVLKVIYLCAFSLFLFVRGAHSLDNNKFLFWERLHSGLLKTTYKTGKGFSDLLILKIDPKAFSFKLVNASDFGKKRANVRTMTKSVNGITGINANFFDKKENPLGLVIDNSKTINPLHKGGMLLNGLFLMRGNTPYILDRKSFKNKGYNLGFQAGPLLIRNEQASWLRYSRSPNRRSVIAIDTKGQVLLAVTLSRFPGLSLEKLQTVLLDKSLHIKDALNLDGGGSSQLYIKEENLFINGGDFVPTALVVAYKQ